MWKKWIGRKETENKSAEIYADIDLSKLPRHIAIIMDGNGRWAQKQGLLRTFGHRVGVESLKEIVRSASNIGIKALTAYAFSTENWKRPDEEVTFLMNLFSEYIDREIDELDAENIKIRFIGRIEELSDQLKIKFENAQTRTADNTGLILNLAVNYGSRDEITRAVKIIAQKVVENKVSIDAIDEKMLEDSLDTAGVPPLDLVIRPGGDYRISNFLLWQAAYAEFWYTNINWPDFKPCHLYEAIRDYQKRDRRFGGVKAKSPS